MIPINGSDKPDFTVKDLTLYVALPVFVTWFVGGQAAGALLSNIELFPDIPIWVHAIQGVFVAALAAGTVQFLSEVRPTLVASIGRAAGSVTLAVFTVTLFMNGMKGASLVQQLVIPGINALGTGIPTFVGLYLYRGRSSASPIGNKGESSA